MNETWERWLKRASELPDAALDWGREGVAFLRSSLGGLPFFAATSVDTSKANPERDETHYFLIPDPGSDEGFSLAERRRLPEGVGSVNSLPKVRVFHVHDPAAVGVLEAQRAKFAAGAKSEFVGARVVQPGCDRPPNGPGSDDGDFRHGNRGCASPAEARPRWTSPAIRQPGKAVHASDCNPPRWPLESLANLPSQS